MARRNVRAQHSLSLERKEPASGLGHWFTRFSERVANTSGSPWMFIAVITLILVWLLTGPIFGFSDTWQLVANTVTTLVTTAMVFLIQNTQNRDSRAIHLKLDELIRATPKARNTIMEAEEEDLDEIEREKKIVDKADPAPPEHKKEDEVARRQTASRNGHGNGKTKG